ncbi:hypothetical protein SAMN04515648_1947 [Phyllobacterium sp. CL33Tsu]|jgi:hypothetical protein|nr:MULTISPECIES: hypothetical protein [Phyllobacterium]UGY11157.1 hypothetical protein LLE51_000125 [Phyllobacterium sp. T1018]SFI83521.1 hypothetical protein SAMN04515648_1947 [Phyllobacterium sp. CL33Tsu]
MARKEDYREDEPRLSGTLMNAGTGLLRITLLFGSAAIALALIIAPLADRGSQSVVDYSAGRSLDEMATGSIRKDDPSTKTYTIHRSVLQRSPNAVCIIKSDGSQSGDC